MQEKKWRVKRKKKVRTKEEKLLRKRTKTTLTSFSFQNNFHLGAISHGGGIMACSPVWEGPKSGGDPEGPPRG